MTRGPYKRKPRLKVDALRHHDGDVVTVDSTRWIIRWIDGNKVYLEASASDSRIGWHTTLDHLPAPTKGKS